MTWHFVTQIVCVCGGGGWGACASAVYDTVKHSDNITRCVHVLLMTLSSILILTVGHDSITKCVCV